MRRVLSTVALAATGLFAFATSATTADILTVCASGCQYTSINAAIEAASDDDVIQLSSETYSEGSVIDIDGKAITIRGATDKAGDPASILDGGGTHTVLKNIGCGSATEVVVMLEHLVIQNGSGSSGGGMMMVCTSPTLENCTFTNNSASSGAGLYCVDSTATLSNCRFTGNTAYGDGGGMMGNGSTLVLVDCTFTDNASSEAGGGLHNIGGSADLSGCTFTENSAEVGGGLMDVSAEGHVLSLVDCTFTGNEASNDGGGLFAPVTTGATLSGCTFTGNSAQDTGGGIWTSGSGVRTLDACTFTGNHAEGEGGGIWMVSNSVNLDYCAFTANSASAGGGVFVIGDQNLSLTACRLWCNTPEAIQFIDETATYVDLGCNCIRDGDGCAECPIVLPGGDFTVDSDEDGRPDHCDGCPDDAGKIEPGDCGCGVADTGVFGDVDCDGDYDADDVRLGMVDFGITEGTPGDLNGDGNVDLDDRAALNAALGLCAADVTGDGVVDGTDLAHVLGYWGVCSAP